MDAGGELRRVIPALFLASLALGSGVISRHSSGQATVEMVFLFRQSSPLRAEHLLS